jgi:hypothetical protein
VIMEDQNLSSQGQDGLATDVMESLGEPKDVVEKVEEPDQSEGNGDKEALPDGVKDRLWRQERKHQREMKQMKAQLESMQSNLRSQPNMDDSYTSDNIHENGNVDEQIQRAVSYALQHKDMQERKAKDAERAQHIHKQYGELQKHLDDTSDKYEDFEDVVRGEGAPFTAHMRDAALVLPRKGAGSAGEVLYKLGKNPAELDRISKLHPLDQASEMVRLSHALISGAESKTPESRPLGQIKNNPVTNTRAVTEKTPVSEIRARMKAGWK